MPTYTILPSSTDSMIIVDITHDDGTVRTNVGFKLSYKDAADLTKQLDAAVLANQVTHYRLKAEAKADADVRKLVGKQLKVRA